MTRHQQITIRCPNCDNVIETVPRDHRFDEEHIMCPNCGAAIEAPSEAALVDAFELAGELIGILRHGPK
jgi:uncharacterized C2H2 Zn-finger protein